MAQHIIVAYVSMSVRPGLHFSGAGIIPGSLHCVGNGLVLVCQVLALRQQCFWPVSVHIISSRW